MIDYWLRMGLVIYGLLLFLVIYRDYRNYQYYDIPDAIFFSAFISFISSLFLFMNYFILNLFVGSGL